MNYNLLSDNELIERFRNSGNNAIVGVLFQRYAYLVQGVCYKYLKQTEQAEDACMEIFEKLHRDLRRHTVVQFRAWLCMVARNHCLMILRKPQGLVDYNDDYSPEAMQKLDDDNSIVLEKETKINTMEDCLTTLKIQQRQCVEMFFLQDKSYKEIQMALNLEFNDVKTNIQNGKLNLKKCIEKAK